MNISTLMAAVAGLSKVNANLRKYALQIFTTLLSGSATIKVGGFQVTATDTKSTVPVRLTIQNIELGLLNVVAGTTGTFTSGNTTVTVERVVQ